MAIQNNSDGDAATESKAPKARDVDDLIQRSLIQSILEAERTLNETIRDVDQACAVSGLDRHTGNQLIHHELEQYIHQLLPLLETSEIGKHYLHEKEIGKVQMEPPTPKEAYESYLGDTTRNNWFEVEEEPGPAKVRTIRGLSSLLNPDLMVTETFHYEIWVRWDSKVVEFDHTVQMPVPRSLLMDGFKAAKRFAHEAGIGLEMNAEEGTHAGPV